MFCCFVFFFNLKKFNYIQFYISLNCNYYISFFKQPVYYITMHYQNTKIRFSAFNLICHRTEKKKKKTFLIRNQTILANLLNTEN